MERRRFLKNFALGVIAGGSVGGIFGSYAALSVDREKNDVIIDDAVQIPVTPTPVDTKNH